jgi:hypothetical protein
MASFHEPLIVDLELLAHAQPTQIIDDGFVPETFRTLRGSRDYFLEREEGLGFTH